MANISFFFPKAKQGGALGINGGLGNMGVSVMQLLAPLAISMSIFAVFGGTGVEQPDGSSVDPHRDRAQMLKVESVQQAWQQWLNKLPPARRDDEDVQAIRWMIEELRVSFFAQQLGTPYPISDKRILQAMEQITA
jgi:nitrate/nitrite transporter NarK